MCERKRERERESEREGARERSERENAFYLLGRDWQECFAKFACPFPKKQKTLNPRNIESEREREDTYFEWDRQESFAATFDFVFSLSFQFICMNVCVCSMSEA